MKAIKRITRTRILTLTGCPKGDRAKGASHGAMTALFQQFRQISQTISASKPDLRNLDMCLIWGSAKYWPEVRLSRCDEPRADLRHSDTQQQLVRSMMDDGDSANGPVKWSLVIDGEADVLMAVLSVTRSERGSRVHKSVGGNNRLVKDPQLSQYRCS